MGSQPGGQGSAEGGWGGCPFGGTSVAPVLSVEAMVSGLAPEKSVNPYMFGAQSLSLAILGLSLGLAHLGRW